MGRTVFIVASITAALCAVFIGCIANDAPGDGSEERTALQQSAVVQPPQSERDKCHGAPSCVLPRNQPGCRIRGECVAPVQCAPGEIADLCNPGACCSSYTTCQDSSTVCQPGFFTSWFGGGPPTCCEAANPTNCVPIDCP